MSAALTFAQNLKKLRAAQKKTLRTVGAEIGISAAALCLYESLNKKRFRTPDVQIMEKLAEYYGVQVTDLFIKDIAARKRFEYAQGTLEDAVIIVNNHIRDTGLQFRKVAILSDKLVVDRVQ